MKFEDPKILSSEETNQKRERVSKLWKSDNSYYEDSVLKLASREDEIREELKNSGTLSLFYKLQKKNFFNKIIKNIPGLKNYAIKKERQLSGLADVISDKDLDMIEKEKESWIDKLTGLRSRTALESEVPTILEWNKRNEKNCVLLMLDMDHFRDVNNTYGHQMGDVVLKVLADRLKEILRKTDKIYRYGGEEILVVLDDVSVEDAEQIAEKMRDFFETHPFHVLSGDDEDVELKKTMSVGVVGADQTEEWRNFDLKKGRDNDNKLELRGLYESLVQKADAALYAAKETGRNKVVVWQEGMKKNNK